MLQMTITSMVDSLGLFPLWIPVLAFIGWLIRKSFATIPPFPNLPQSWSFKAPSPAITPILERTWKQARNETLKVHEMK